MEGNSSVTRYYEQWSESIKTVNDMRTDAVTTAFNFITNTPINAAKAVVGGVQAAVTYGQRIAYNTIESGQYIYENKGEIPNVALTAAADGLLWAVDKVGEALDSAEELKNKAVSSLKELVDHTIVTAEDVDFSPIMGRHYVAPHHCEVPGLDGGNYGADYMEEFKMFNSMVAMAPGSPEMSLSQEAKDKLAEVLAAGASDLTQEQYNTIFSKVGNTGLFGFKQANIDYAKDVTSMLSLCATFMGVYDDNLDAATFSDVPGVGLKNIMGKDGADETMSRYVKYRNMWTSSLNREAVMTTNRWFSFLHDGPVQVQDSISNNTGKSALEQMINSNPLSQISTELAFFVGKDGVKVNEGGKAETGNNGGLMNFIGGTSRLLSTKIHIPEIWQGSATDKSVSLKFRFVAPYGNPTCIFKEIVTPAIHLLALGAPKASIFGGIGYGPPRLVKLINIGTISIEMGMITNITMFKDPTGITPDGLPTILDVNVTVKDLNSMLSLPKDETGAFGTNTSSYAMTALNTLGLGSYLSTLCGYNFSELSAMDRVKVAETSVTQGLKSLVSLAGAKQGIANAKFAVFDYVKNVGGKFFGAISPK